jgi:hypothetical protein
MEASIDMKTITTLVRTGLLLITGFVFATSTLLAQPARDRVLDDLEMVESEEAVTITVNLTIPVRYIRHFPYDAGDELRINVMPFDVRSEDREALLKRESLAPFRDELPFLEEVVYEGDIEGGRYLTLFFNKVVAYEVEQGRDSRSLVVHVKRSSLGAAAGDDTGNTNQ